MAEREWRVDEAGQKGTKREQCCPVLFSVYCVRPTTHSEHHSVHPSLIYPDILQWHDRNFCALMRSSLMMTALYLCIPIPFRTIYTIYGHFTVLRESHFLSVTNNLFSRSSLRYSKRNGRLRRRGRCSHAT